jgi:HEAT repeat protein
LVGLRSGIPPELIAEARLGEVVETLWDSRAENIQPLVVRALVEARRQAKRFSNVDTMPRQEETDTEAIEWQVNRLIALEPLITDYLSEAPAALCLQLRRAAASVQTDLLAALEDLHGEAAEILVPLLDRGDFGNKAAAFGVLRWSRSPLAGPWLRSWIEQRLAPRKTAGRGWFRSRTTLEHVSNDDLLSAIAALRGHPGRETEHLLLRLAERGNDRVRRAAAAASAWSDPLDPSILMKMLQKLRRDRAAEVRQAARAALARLGERQALQAFRLGLVGDDGERIHQTIQTIAAENLILLWPELDRLADSDDADTAFLAREALEHLRENLGER